MIDFNDPKITKQEKDDFLRLQIDKEYKKERDEYGYEPIHRYWILTIEELKKINKNALKNDGIFDFYEESLEKCFPDQTVGLFECDRVEEGEWDKDYKVWSDRSYVRCICPLTLGGMFVSAKENAMEIAVFKMNPEEEEASELIFKYPNTFNKDGMFRQPKEQGTGGGVIEFSPHLLDGLEMVEKRLYRLKNDYNTLKSSILKSYWDDKDRKQNRRSRSHRGRRIKKNIRSSIAKGFSL